MIAITGSTGQLGRLVINRLLESIPAAQIIAIVRDPSKAAGLAARGVVVRKADYNDPASLDAALTGVERLLLISSNEIGRRFAQHANVIAAAKRQRVKLLVYTSLLRADTSPLNLAGEHAQTEIAIKSSGLSHVILRNGWYTENYTASVPAALAHNALLGSADDARISSATRADYAAAAAKILAGTTDAHANHTIELAGDTSYTLADLAAEISRQSGKKVIYQNLPEADYAKALAGAGVPAGFAAALARWDTSAAQGALFDEGRQLGKLLGRPTTPLAEAVQQALAR